MVHLQQHITAMQAPQPNRQPPDLKTELAKKRNQAAAERTLMAWIRTSLSLISFGFGIDQIVAALNNIAGIDNPLRLTRILGLFFISLGTWATVAAASQHRQELKHIQHKDYTYIPERSISLIVANALFVFGIMGFVGILVKAFY